MNKTVCHMTSVHPRTDVRIFRKECLSLVDAGFQVVLLIADQKGDERKDGVYIKDLGKYKSVFKRIFIAPIMFTIYALKQRSLIYHFHDPELILAGILLRLFGKKVIYDIHEDYSTSFAHRSYIPKFLVFLSSFLWSLYENFFSIFFHQIIAEKYYQRRFPRAIKVLNYPQIQNDNTKSQHGIGDRLIYTGGINVSRGALNHIQLLNGLPEIKITMIGYCANETFKLISDRLINNKSRLEIVGLDEYVNFSIIDTAYKQNTFLCGLAIFPKSKHYYEKELTKFFEYMQYGIPIVCSNFPVWKKLIEHNNCGICVNPINQEEIIKAIEYLYNNPDASKQMGLNGMQLVNMKCNWKNEEQKLLDFYKKIIAID